MEERVIPSPKESKDDPPFLPYESHPSRKWGRQSETEEAVVEHESQAGTYVVQVPKVQIYRIPPPENAIIAERFRNPENQKRPCSIFFTKCFIMGIIIVLVLGICAALIYLAVKPKNPTFSIERVSIKNSHSSRRPEYHISLNGDNPNDRLTISYKKGGNASLLFKKQKIATGKTNAMDLNSHDSKSLNIVLAGSKDKLPSETEKKKKVIPLFLTVTVPMEMEVWVVKLWTADITIECDLEVNTLSENTRVINQKCNVKV
ncbi:hypothetical protein ACHQM5_022437 [Ranunculus cassubicifolius]